MGAVVWERLEMASTLFRTIAPLLEDLDFHFNFCV